MSMKQETLTFDRMMPWCAETGVSAKELSEDGLTLLTVSASACCGRAEVLKEEILAEGTVTFCALLRTREGDVKSLTRTERFSFNKKTNGDAGDKAHLLLKAEAGSVHGYQEAGSLMFSCRVRLSGLLIVPGTLTVPVLSDGGCFLKKQKVDLLRVPLIRSLRFSVPADTVLSPRMPEVKRVLNCQASVCVREAHLSAGQLILGGDLLTQTVYEAADEYEPVVEVTDRSEFSQLLDIGDASPSLKLFVSLSPEDVAVTIDKTEDGEMRKLVFSVLLCGYVFGTMSEEKELITDAFSTEETLNCQVETPVLTVPAEPVKGSANRRLIVPLPDNKPAMARINAVTFSVISGPFGENGNGCADVGVLYTAAGTGELEGFSVCLPLPDDGIRQEGPGYSSAVLKDMQAVLLSGHEAEVRFGLENETLPLAETDQPVITGITAEKREPSEFGLIVCLVQPGETLWTIAKRYGVAPETLLNMNPGLTETPEIGRKICVFRKLTES